MEQTKRQKQIGQQINEALSQILIKAGFNVVNGGMVSISKVLMTPDLLEARVYLSFYKVAEPKALMEDIVSRKAEWRNLLGQEMRHQLRRIPELQFFVDDTMEYVDKMESLFRKLEEEKANAKEGSGDTAP